MDYLNISVPSNVKIAVVGDIHEHEDQFFDLIDTLPVSSELWLVSVGDVCDKGFGAESRDRILLKLKEFNQAGQAFMIKGNHEVSRIRKAVKANLMTEGLAWANTLPLALSFVFNGGFRLTVVHAGVQPSMTMENLATNLNVCYIRKLDEEGHHIPLIWQKDETGHETLVEKKAGGTIWHDVYDGRFGYIASGHCAQTDGEAKFYKYSSNLDSCCYGTGILTAQLFSSEGPGEVVRVKGEASDWKLTSAWKKD